VIIWVLWVRLCSLWFTRMIDYSWTDSRTVSSSNSYLFFSLLSSRLVVNSTTLVIFLVYMWFWSPKFGQVPGTAERPGHDRPCPGPTLVGPGQGWPWSGPAEGGPDHRGQGKGQQKWGWPGLAWPLDSVVGCVHPCRSSVNGRLHQNQKLLPLTCASPLIAQEKRGWQRQPGCCQPYCRYR
jgi:hypothetical protein